MQSPQGDLGWPCLPFFTPATLAPLLSLSTQPTPGAPAQLVCSEGRSSPDPCMLYTLVSFRWRLTQHLLTCVPYKTVSQRSCCPLTILYNPYATHTIYSFSTTVCAREGGALSVCSVHSKFEKFLATQNW